ncbi:hypothetical protein [Vibrio cortegadensis]|uniref:Uncharacterized protein n=1 Tax=Vibrio cortegadensis TaxID=1328770 RepID=A0ABV4MBD3_9VIBR
MKINTFILSFMLLSTTASASTLIEITKISGKSKEQVASILGKAIECSKNKYGMKCSYHMAETEIVYINGKADWITVEGIDDIPFNKTALKSLGITVTRPIHKNAYSLRWSNINGIKEVSIFKGEKYSDYAYIKVYTD